MPDFAYHAIDPAGKERTGHLRADTAEDARAVLTARKLYVVRVAQRTDSGAPARGLTIWRPTRLNSKELTLFTRQLSTLAQVSPLEEALRTIGRQSERDHVRAVIGRVHLAVMEGRQLADAFGAEPKSFPPIYRAMIAAGERSGSLPTIMDRLAELMERQALIRSRVIAAIAYPSVLALFSVGVVVSLMVFVVPRIVDQFADMGQQLPLLTRIVIALSALMAGYWWAILAAMALVALVARQALKDEAAHLRFDAFLLRLPIIGRLIRDLHAARMARTLSTMVGSRLPLMEGVALTTSTIRNRVLRRASDDIVEAIRGGGSLSAALRRAGVFPPLLVYLAASGETAGRLDVMLERAADYLEREFDAFTSATLALLEPLIIILMGGLVAVIILSILLPILQLQSLTGA